VNLPLFSQFSVFAIIIFELKLPFTRLVAGARLNQVRKEINVWKIGKGPHYPSVIQSDLCVAAKLSSSYRHRTRWTSTNQIERDDE
jgi:hypothetical protein